MSYKLLILYIKVLVNPPLTEENFSNIWTIGWAFKTVSEHAQWPIGCSKHIQQHNMMLDLCVCWTIINILNQTLVVVYAI